MEQQEQQPDPDLTTFEVVISYESTNFQIVKIAAPTMEMATEKIKSDFELNADQHGYYNLQFRSVQELNPNQKAN